MREACFAVKVAGDYQEKIRVFFEKYSLLKISYPLKIHLLTHVPEFLTRKYEKGFSEDLGLGYWSEQSFESAHSDWKKHWARFCVGHDHAEYKPSLLRAIASLNSLHV